MTMVVEQSVSLPRFSKKPFSWQGGMVGGGVGSTDFYWRHDIIKDHPIKNINKNETLKNNHI